MKKARKILLIIGTVLLAAALLWVGCIFTSLNWQYIFDLRSQAEPYTGSWITTVATDEGVRVEIPADDGVKYVEFSTDRKPVEAQGVTLIAFDHRNLWGYWSYEGFMAEYGEYHAELGNIFWPGWITTDGYLISMWRGGERIFPLCIGNLGEVWVYDLLAE